MFEIKNLLFQPLTFHLAGGNGGLHLNPRARIRIGKDAVSPEISLAARRGFISLTEVSDALGADTPMSSEPMAPSEPDATTVPAKSRRRSGKASASNMAGVGR